MGAVLGLSGASVDATVATTTQARSTAAVDAAAQVAINTVQNSTYNNDVASATYPKCFGNTGTSDSMVVPYPGGGGGSTFVTCAPDPGSGAAGGLVPITNQNKPGNAILTLGTSPAEDGIDVKALSGVPFNVHGSVVSNSNIVVSNGTLQSNAGVYAHTGLPRHRSSATPRTACMRRRLPTPTTRPKSRRSPPTRPVPANTAANCPGKRDDASCRATTTTPPRCPA